ncbi:MFS transporter [Chryseobacterium paridis]|uniref:MFS transporter n=1 Tax=Chryseobacterium paridis TaxID=2800328 RepID=A0ABS1FSK6_9FLAO|nr:MFS transporter [Chryseobacterium paridis]MBK1895379.1 MFS transporter [Chryseobacterium paridis]
MKSEKIFGKGSITLIAICIAALMFGLEISSVPVILPILEKVLQGNLKDMQWIMNAYTLACTTIPMAAGTLADRFGRKFIFIITLIAFGLTSLFCGFAVSPTMLIAARFLQGMSGGAMLICQIAILSFQFQGKKERSRAFAVWGIVFGTGLGFGPIIGGAIVSLANWQWVFLVHVPLTIVALLLVTYSVRESSNPNAKKLDLPGILTLSVAVFGLIFYIMQGEELGFTSLVGLLIISVSAISFVLFLIVEKYNENPMFDFSVFKIRNFSGAILGSIGMNFSFWPLMIYLPIYFQIYLGYNIVNAGLALLAYTLPTLLIPPLAERLSLKYQPRIIIPSGLFIIGLGFILMMVGCSVRQPSWLTMLPGSLLAGIGLGLTNTPVTNTITGSVSDNRVGMASGIDMSARLITLAINIALMGFLLQEGTLSYLKRTLTNVSGQFSLESLAEKITSDSISTLKQNFPQLSYLDSSGTIVHEALNNGFANIMLYGGIGVWILALLSFMIFGSGKSIR